MELNKKYIDIINTSINHIEDEVNILHRGINNVVEDACKSIEEIINHTRKSIEELNNLPDDCRKDN